MDRPVTTATLVRRLQAVGFRYDSRWVERQRDNGLLKIAEVQNYGGWAKGRFGVYDAGAEAAVVAIARHRSAGAKSYDLIVQVALDGHQVSLARLLQALRAGPEPIRRIRRFADPSQRMTGADLLVNFLERHPAKRAEWCFLLEPDELDSAIRALFDDVVGIVIGKLDNGAKSAILVMRAMLKMTSEDDEALNNLGITNIPDLFIDAAKRLREGYGAVESATEADAGQSLAVLRAMIELRNELIVKSHRGNPFFSIAARALSNVPLNTAFGLFCAFVVTRIAD